MKYNLEIKYNQRMLFKGDINCMNYLIWFIVDEMFPGSIYKEYPKDLMTSNRLLTGNRILDYFWKNKTNDEEFEIIFSMNAV
jgi:hypothetical protein